ncbi:MAG: flagellar type III secretion system pore protein FliP [Deltaproteobacteria bacterium]|nr:flagellar type III secretion system pore protein FliP [Deltaproteobacteria bacterium]
MSLRSRGVRWAVRWGSVAAFAILAIVSLPSSALAADAIHIDFGTAEATPIAATLRMLLVLTAITLAPAAMLAASSFVRIIVVLSFLRTGLGLQNMPPPAVMTGLALFMTLAIMNPIATQVYTRGVEPFLDGKVTASQAYEAGTPPLRDFMLRQTRSDDLALFYEIGRLPAPATPNDVKLHVLAPAFLLSELRTSFEMGFLVLVPFLVIDLVVASVLTAMGMVMLPPTLVSLPIKVMVFVLADGWNLLVRSLVRSFG